MNVFKKTERPRSRVLNTLDSPSQTAIPSANHKDVRLNRGLPNRSVNLHNRTAAARAAVNKDEARIVKLEVTEDAIVAHFADGRTVSVPLTWSWRLTSATPRAAGSGGSR